MAFFKGVRSECGPVLDVPPPETSRIHASAVRKVRKVAPRKCFFFFCLFYLNVFRFLPLMLTRAFTTRGSLGLKGGSGCSRTGAWRRWTPELQQKSSQSTQAVGSEPVRAHRALKSGALYSPARFTVTQLCSFHGIRTRETRG